jgi:DNA gyrase/topoisomerase IV subunit B
MADADTHGYHITDILLGDLYALCPALINNGHVYVTIPPLYSLNIKGREPIYIRDNYELNATLAFAVYYNSLDIGFHTGTQSRNLTREEFVAFSEIVCRIGDELDRLSVEYMIPAVLLEQLSLMTSHLNLRQPDINVIRSYLGCEVRYVESGHLLIISIGSDDIIVPLNQITELIYARILPLYRTFYYGKVRITATTKRSKALVNSPISIAQLYQMFKELDKMFTIKRYKGLGSMPPEDIAKNCVNPNTRKVHQIINIGDLKTVFHMLGDDPTERKRLVLN